jgi:glycerol kinase
MLGVPVEVPVIRETTALGAAYLAGLATGIWTLGGLAKLWRVERRYEPRMKAAERGRLYARWLRAVDRSRAWEDPA